MVWGGAMMLCPTRSPNKALRPYPGSLTGEVDQAEGRGDDARTSPGACHMEVVSPLSTRPS